MEFDLLLFFFLKKRTNSFFAPPPNHLIFLILMLACISIFSHFFFPRLPTTQTFLNMDSCMPQREKLRTVTALENLQFFKINIKPVHQPALNYMALEIRNYLGKKTRREKKSRLPGEVRLYDTRPHNIQYNCTFVYYSCVAYLALPLVFLTSFSFKLMKTESEHVDQAALSHQVLDSAA